MKIKQNLFILFFLRKNKISKNGKIPIYIRITIDTDSDEISLGQKVQANQWDDNKKSIKTEDCFLSFLLEIRARTGSYMYSINTYPKNEFDSFFYFPC